jgi:hypothetical protein
MMDVHRFGICFRIDGNSGEAEVVAGSNDPDGDFASICYEYFLH